MATVLELAEYADVSAEAVLRVLRGEPVSEELELRVREAMDVLGTPAYPRPKTEILPAVAPQTPARPDDEAVVERFRQAAAELEATLPQGVGTVVYEALRVEVRPVAEHVAELGMLFERMLSRLEQISTEVGADRAERLDDIALLTELVTSGWRSVDRRLGRLEKIVGRLEAGRSRRPEARLYRLDDAAERASAD